MSSGDLPIYLWLALAIYGLWLSRLNGTEAVGDYFALGGKTNGRRTIALGNIRREIVRGLIDLDFLILGVLALFDALSGGVLVVGLLLASAGMNLNSHLDRSDRLYLTKHGLQARDDQGRFVSDQEPPHA